MAACKRIPNALGYFDIRFAEPASVDEQRLTIVSCTGIGHAVVEIEADGMMTFAEAFMRIGRQECRAWGDCEKLDVHNLQEGFDRGLDLVHRHMQNRADGDR